MLALTTDTIEHSLERRRFSRFGGGGHMLSIKQGYVGVGCLALVSAVACSSPTGPSVNASGATISGLVNTSGAAAVPSTTATTVDAGLTVRIDGTELVQTVDASGKFQFVGVPRGDAQLRFSGPNVRATTVIFNVSEGEEIEVEVVVSGDSAVIASLVRRGKVELCHNGHLIVVSESAEPAHRDHGDAKVGEPVPGTLTKVFDDACQPRGLGVNLEKFTNNQDADHAPGPSIVVGSPVTWRYVVTNTSTVALTDVAVLDDQLGVVACGQTTLSVGESMTCMAGGIAAPGPYQNIGTATADSSEGPVMDRDPSHYTGITDQPGETVQICHIPPGNPANAHTITVGADAVAAHLAHGDSLGPCP